MSRRSEQNSADLQYEVANTAADLLGAAASCVAALASSCKGHSPGQTWSSNELAVSTVCKLAATKHRPVKSSHLWSHPAMNSCTRASSFSDSGIREGAVTRVMLHDTEQVKDASRYVCDKHTRRTSSLDWRQVWPKKQASKQRLTALRSQTGSPRLQPSACKLTWTPLGITWAVQQTTKLEFICSAVPGRSKATRDQAIACTRETKLRTCI